MIYLTVALDKCHAPSYLGVSLDNSDPCNYLPECCSRQQCAMYHITLVTMRTAVCHLLVDLGFVLSLCLSWLGQWPSAL